MIQPTCAFAAEDHTRQHMVRAWAAYKVPPLLLPFICGGLPPGEHIAIRVREIVRACLLASPQEYHNKRYGEILNLITKVGGAIKHLAADKASSFHYILEHLVDIEVVRHDAPTAVSEMEADKDGVRFGLDTIASEVINSPNFYNLAVVVNTIEVPYQAVFATRTEQWYTVNQD